MTDATYPLTDADRAEIARYAARLGLRRTSRELGIDVAALASLAARRERVGTRAILYITLPRLRAELLAHDAERVVLYKD